MKIAIVTSRFNPEITQGLLRGAKNYLLKERRMTLEEIETFEAPGAFELPLIAKQLAKTKKYAGVICLGTVIKGETAHFEYISLATSMGILQASLETEIPITFGVLTTYTEAQALARCADNPENKGKEAASACAESIETLLAITRETS